jgi:hypothetical protein
MTDGLPLASGLLAVTDDGGQYTGLTGLVIVLVLGIVTVLLIVNMNRRIRRLPREFPKEQTPPEQDGRPAPPREG